MINIPDADLLSNGTFEQAGLDLHVHGHDGRHVVIPNYFANSHHAALVAPNGERLSSDEIALLAGRYAEAHPGNTASDAAHHAGPGAIGRVDKISGDVTVLRNGMSVTLHAGDAIYKNDVIQTGSGSSVAISFSDGTALNLVANTRMALNDYSFDGSSGHALFTLQEGTFAFVAGKIGDMKIATPVGFMSIHEGTTGWAHELSAREIAAISSKLGNVTFSFAVVNTADSHGVYELLVKGAVVGDIGDPNLIWYLDQDGNLISMPLDHSQEFADGLPRDFMSWIEADIATRSLAGIHGSGSPIDPSLFPQAVNLNQLGPTFDFDPLRGGLPFTVNLPTPNNDEFLKFHSNLFIWNGFGNWDLQWLNWDTGFPPTEPIDIVIINSGKSNYFSNYAVANLTVNLGATLNIFKGSLTVGGLANAGLIEINSSGVDPALIINGDITLTGHGTIEMLGFGPGNFILGNPGKLTNVDNLIAGSGNIGAGDGKLTFINEGIVAARPILDGDSGQLLINTGNAVQNFGVLEAVVKGELLIQDRFFNFGTIKADGPGSSVLIDNDSRTINGNVPGNANGNAGLIEAVDGGKLTIRDATIINSGTGAGGIVDGLVFAGIGSEIVLQNATILEGLVEVAAGGLLDTVSGTTNRIDTSNGPTHNTTQPSIVNAGKILINDDSTLILASPFDIDNSGTIELASTGNKTLLEFNQPFAILSGGGNVILDGGKSGSDEPPGEGEGGGKGIGPAQDIIDGLPGAGFATASLENRDNTISGAGAIGQGNGALRFQNDAQGTVDADLFRQTLLIATGANTIVNAGLFEATHGGELKIESKLDNSGKVIAHTFSEVLIEADVVNEDDGRIVARGVGARVDIDGTPGHRVSVDNSGRIVARHDGTVDLDFTDLTNEEAGRIVATGWGSRVEVERSTVDNSGKATARHHGTVEFADDRITNESDGLIRATGRGSEVRFDRDRVRNDGEIIAEHHGDVVFERSHIDNRRDGTIEADGRGSKVTFDRDRVDNSGLIEAEHHGRVEFDKSSIDNDRRGRIEATGRGSEVRFEHDRVDNSGLIEAEHHGRVEFDKSYIDNDHRGTIEADGRGSKVAFDRDIVRNSGRIEAGHGGEVEFERSFVGNERRGIIEADGWGAEIEFEHDLVNNAGLIKAGRGGEIEFEKSLIGNDCSGSIEADGKGAKITVARSGVLNWGFIGASWGGSILFDKSWIKNQRDGEIEAEGRGSEVTFKHDHVDNSGLIDARRGGEVEFTRSHIDNERRATIEADGKGSKVEFDRDHVGNSGHIDAEHGGEVTFTRSGIDNQGRGTIEADGYGSKVKFERDRISNWGAIAATWGGLVSIEESWVRNERYGEIEADGKGSEVVFRHDHIDNSGAIEARHGGEVEFDRSHVDNHGYGSIEASGNRSKVTFERDRVDNWGFIGATWGGSALLKESTIKNRNGGEIEADGKGSEVRFRYDRITNSGRIEADRGGEIDVSRSHVENDRHGIIEADGWAAEIDFDRTGIENWGTIRAVRGGSIGIENSWILNGGEIEATGHDSAIEFKDDHLRNFGRTEAEHHGEVKFDKTHVDNSRHGRIEADGNGSEVKFDRSHVDNRGTIEAEHQGKASLDRSWIDNDGVIEATRGGSIIVEHSHVDNQGGLIAAYDTGSTVSFERSFVHGGTLTTASGGVIETVKGTSTFEDLTISAGSDVHAEDGSKLALKGDISELGTISVMLQGELDLISATVDGGTTGVINNLGVVDVSATDTLQDITVAGGDMIVEGSATLHLEHAVHLDGVNVVNHGDIIVDLLANPIPAKLTVDDGTAIVGGHLTINEFGTVDVEKGNNAAGPNGAVLDGVTVTDNGLIDIRGDSTAILDDGTVISGAGLLRIESGSTLDVEQGSGAGPDHGATIDGMFVDVDGALDVGDPANGAVLTLQSGAVIESVSGTGKVKVNAGSTIDVESGTGGVSGFSAAIAGVTVTDAGVIEVGLLNTGAVLEIGDVTVNGNGTGELHIHGVSTLDVEASNNTFDGLLVTADGAFDVGDESTSALTLQDGTIVSGAGTLTIQQLDVSLGKPPSTLDVEAGANGQGATFDGIDVVIKGELDIGVVAAATLTLEDGVSVTGTGALTVKSGSKLAIEKGSGIGPDHGATLDGMLVDVDGALDVGDVAEGAVLTLQDGAFIETILDTGTVTIKASSSIDVKKGNTNRSGFDAAIAGVDITDKGAIEVETGAMLGIGGDAVVEGAGTGTLTVHQGATLDIENNATFDALLVTADGAFDVGDRSTSFLTLEGGTIVSGTGTLTIQQLDPNLGKPPSTLDVEAGANGQGATFDGIDVVTKGKLDIGDTAAATLTLKSGTSITGKGTITVGLTSTLDVEKGTGTGGATLDGINVTDSGKISVGPGGAVLTLNDDTSIAGGGTGLLAIALGSKLDIETGATGGGALLNGVTVTDGGTIEISANAALGIGNTVTLNGSGTVTMDQGSAITDNGAIATLDNNGNTISGQGAIGGSNLRLTNEASGVIDANVAGALVLDAAVTTNKGLLEATDGATLDIKTSVTNTSGHIEAHGTGSTVELEAITVTDGVIEIDAGSTLAIENATTVLNNVDVQNNGNLQIDDASVTAKLVLGSGTSLDGQVTIGATGELDVNGAIFGNIVIDDSGIFEVDGPLTLNGDFTVHIHAGGSFIDTGVLTIGSNKVATLSGATFNEIDIATNATVTLDGANASVVDFTGADGTLVLKTPTGFTGTIKDLSTGDIIDLGGVVASSVTFDGTTLKINGTPTTFSIAGGLPSGDTFAFKDDGHGGTDLKVIPKLVSVATASLSGTEGSAIALGIAATPQGAASLASVTISGIPAGAALSDNNGDTFTVVNGSITVAPGQLAGLSITPANDTNFTLSIVATDSAGFQSTVATSEAVTVSPLAPSVSWAAGSAISDGDESTAAVALNVGVGKLTGDGTHNSLTSVVISGIQVGATLSDGTHSFKAPDASHTSVDVTAWTLANLTITPAALTNFTLTATVTETDSDNPAQTSTAQANLKIVSGTDWTQAAGGDWTAAGYWDEGVPTANINAAIEATVVKATSDYTVTVSTADVAQMLTVDDAHATLADAVSLTIGEQLTIDDGLVDVKGGDIGSGGTTPGGTLTVGGSIVVNSGALVVEPGTGSSGFQASVGAAALTAASIDVEQGGRVFLGGAINVSGVIATDGGDLLVGPAATFTLTHAVTIVGGSAEFQGDQTVPYALDVTFAGPGELFLDHAVDASGRGRPIYAGTISGFGPNDTVALMDLRYTPGGMFEFWDASSGRLTIQNGDGQRAILKLSGSFDNGSNGGINDFTLKQDPKGQNNFGFGTDIVWGGPSQITWSTGPDTPITVGSGKQLVTLTVKDLDGVPISGLSVVPSLSGVGQFVDDNDNPITGPLNLTTNASGQVAFLFDPGNVAGIEYFSALIDGNVTSTTKVFVVPDNASTSTSSLSAALVFDGSGERATLTLHDEDQFGNGRYRDAVTWSGQTGDTFSPASGETTDVNGVATTTLTPHTIATEIVTASLDGISKSTTVNFIPLHTWNHVGSGNWTTAGDWAGGVPGATDAAFIGVAGTYTVTVSSNQSVYGLSTIATATLDITGSNTLNIAGSLTSTDILAGALQLDSGGTLRASRGETVVINGALGGSGGTLVADGATIDVNGSITGAQNITVAGAGTIHVAKALSTSDAITFAGAGLVALDAAPTGTGAITVNNFGAGDNLVLGNLAFSSDPSVESLNWVQTDATHGTLTVTDNGVTETFHLAFSSPTTLTTANFHLETDPLGSGGTDIVVTPPLNFASPQITDITSQIPGANGAQALGINNTGVVSGFANSSTGFLWVDGHGVNFNLVDAISGKFNDSNWAMGTDPASLIHAAIFARPNEDFTTGYFDQYAGTPALALILPSNPQIEGPSAGQNTIGTAVSDAGWAIGYYEDQRQGTVNYLGGAHPDTGFIAIPNGEPLPPGETGILSHNYNYVLFSAGFWFPNDTNPATNFGQSNVIGTEPMAINNNGVVVGYYTTIDPTNNVDVGSIGFVYKNGQFISITGPDGLHGHNGIKSGSLPSQPYDHDIRVLGINDEGLAVGTYIQTDTSFQNRQYGFIYDTNTGSYVAPNFSLANTNTQQTSIAAIDNENVFVANANGDNVYVINPNPVDTIDNGGTLYLNQPSSADVISFAGPTGMAVLEIPQGFRGTIQNFTGTAPDAAHSDVIDLVGVDPTSAPFVSPEGQFQDAVSPGSSTYVLFNFANLTGGLVFTSDGHGGTLIYDPPAGGDATIQDGQTLALTSADDGTITFAGEAGRLQLSDPASFTGTIKGFAGTDAAHSDQIDLDGFDAASTVFTQKNVNGNLVVTATEGDKVATLTFDYVDGALNFANDGFGGTVITNSVASSAPEIGTVDATATEAGVHGTITAADPAASGPLTTSVKAEGPNDVGAFSVHAAVAANGTASVEFNFDFDPSSAPAQAVTQSYDVAVKEGATTVLHQTVSVSVGTANADNFVFSAGVGADTIVNFDAQHDTIDLSHFENIQSMQQLSSMMTTNAHGDAVIDLGNHDSITIAGLTAAQFQQVMQSAVHLH